MPAGDRRSGREATTSPDRDVPTTMPPRTLDDDQTTALIPAPRPGHPGLPARVRPGGDDPDPLVDETMSVIMRLEAASSAGDEEPAEPWPRRALRVATRLRVPSGLGDPRRALLLGGVALGIVLAIVLVAMDMLPFGSTPEPWRPGPGDARQPITAPVQTIAAAPTDAATPGPHAREAPPTAVAVASPPEHPAESAPPAPHIAAAQPAGAVPASRPPRIVGRSPAHDTVTVTAGSMQRFRVSARPAAEDAALTYTWAVDGTVVGTGPDESRTIEATTPGQRTVRVVVTDAAGVATEPVTWRLVVGPPRPRPPQITAQTPRADGPLHVAEDDTIELRVRVHDPDGDERLAYRWLVDGREAGGTPTFRLRAEGAPGTRRTIEARVRDRDGLEAAPVRWKVEITPKLRQAEALAWVDRFKGAWERRDLATFRLYGVVGNDREAEALRERLARQRSYRVQFSQARARVAGRYGSVSFVRRELDGTRVVSTVAETFQLEKHPSGLVTLRGVPAP